MAYRKLVTQSYVNLKGINQKMSEYTLDVTEFRDLRNLDFDVPNALQKRPGSTQALFEGTSGTINSIYEYEKLNGFSQMLVASDNALYYATAGNTLMMIESGFTSGQPLDILTFVDKAWLANGETFINWDGVTQNSYQGGIPNILDTAIVGSTHAQPTFIGFTYPLLSAAFYASVGQSDAIGCFRGATYLNNGFTNASSIKYQGITNTFSGATAIAFYFAVGESKGTGDGTPPGRISLTNPGSFERNPLVFIPIGTTEVEIFDAGSGDYHLFTNGTSFYSGTYGGTNTFSGLGFCFTATYIPKYVEVNNNVMFLSGFSTAPSRMYFSEIGEPENVPAENLIEVRTNDGDRITGEKAFNSDLLIFKERSFHKLIGDDEDNYQLVEISTEYGCLSNKTIVEFQDNLAWLDQQGVVVYNGASWTIMSDQVQDIVRRMNLSAAREKSIAVHWKDRKQVWWSFPIDGSSENNITIVYDYLVKAWTFFEGFDAASFAHAKRGLTRRTAYFGDYSGMVHYFGASFFGDNGQGITCLAKSRYEAPDGQNVQNIFRRLFLDVNNVSGITGTIDCKVFSDYSETVKATFSIYQNSFQTRRDFGVPAKSIAFEFSHFSASLPLLINGFATVRRYLRDV